LTGITSDQRSEESGAMPPILPRHDVARSSRLSV
jgi:hypothetical protein